METLPENEIRNTGQLGADGAAVNVVPRSSDEDPDQVASDLNLVKQDAETSGDPAPEYGMAETRRLKADVGAVNVILRSFDETPDQVASDLRLARDYARAIGGPVPPLELVKQYRDSFRQTLQEAQNAKILSESPFLADWMLNPENAAVASDDLANLSWLETALGATVNALHRTALKVPKGYNQYLAEISDQTARDQKRTLYEIYADETAHYDNEGNVLGHSWLPDPGQLFSIIDRYTNARSPLFADEDMEEQARQYQQRVGEIGKRIAEIPMSPAATRFRKRAYDPLRTVSPERLKQYNQDMLVWDGRGAPPAAPSPTTGIEHGWLVTAQFVKDMAADPGGALALFAETGVEAAPSLAAAAALTAATRNPKLGALAFGTTSGIQERYLKPADYYASKGIDISTPEGADRVISDPALMREAARRGSLRGTVVGVMNGLSGGLAGKVFSESPLGNAVLQSITQAFMGGSTEALAQLAADSKVDMRDVLVQAFSGLATSSVDVARAGGRVFLDGRRRALAADARKTLFQEISSTVQSSAVRKRLPEKLREFINQATANGPAKNLYVPADEFAQYFQTKGIDPYELIDGLDGVTREDLDAALASGGDLKIPTATYAEKIAGSEHDAFLMDNMRFHPGQMTAKQAAEFKAHEEELLKQAQKDAEDARIDRRARLAVEGVEKNAEIVRARRKARRAARKARKDAKAVDVDEQLRRAVEE